MAETRKTAAMVLTYHIDSAGERVCIVGAGTLTMPQMIAAVDDVTADCRFRSHFCVIFDLSNADYTGELNDGEAFVAAVKRLRNAFQGRFGVLVPARLQVLAKLYSMLAGASGFERMQCFTDADACEAWCKGKAAR